MKKFIKRKLIDFAAFINKKCGVVARITGCDPVIITIDAEHTQILAFGTLQGWNITKTIDREETIELTFKGIYWGNQRKVKGGSDGK